MDRLALVLGGGVIAAYLWSRPDRKHRPLATPRALPGTWVWPVAAWKGRAPVVSDGFASPRAGRIRHGGVDVMFARLPADTFPVGSPSGSRRFVMPDNVPVVAASDGVVWSAMPTPRGFAVVIDHGPRKVKTFYTHLTQLAVPLTARGMGRHVVKAGDVIGIVGADPMDPEGVRHLHFEIWLDGPSGAIDPAPLLRSWPVANDPRAPLVARNAGSYRTIGSRGEPYPEWVRALDGRSGVYIIRDLDTHETLYVGSSSGRLYDTLTRHFQQWRRFKGFWKNQYAEGHDPGLTYPRDRVEVSVRLVRADDVLDEEARLIERLRPRDNILAQVIDVAGQEVPF